MTRSASHPPGGAAGAGLGATVVRSTYDRPVDGFFFGPSSPVLDIPGPATLHPATESASAASGTASFKVERMSSSLLMRFLWDCAVARNDRDEQALRPGGPGREVAGRSPLVRRATRMRSSSCCRP